MSITQTSLLSAYAESKYFYKLINNGIRQTMKNPLIGIMIFFSALATATISYPLVSRLFDAINFNNQFLTTLIWSGYIILLIFLIIVLPIAYVMEPNN